MYIYKSSDAQHNCFPPTNQCSPVPELELLSLDNSPCLFLVSLSFSFTSCSTVFSPLDPSAAADWTEHTLQSTAVSRLPSTDFVIRMWSGNKNCAIPTWSLDQMSLQRSLPVPLILWLSDAVDPVHSQCPDPCAYGTFLHYIPSDIAAGNGRDILLLIQEPASRKSPGPSPTAPSFPGCSHVPAGGTHSLVFHVKPFSQPNLLQEIGAWLL